MDLLVLDTIHGGLDLARHLSSAGHRVDCVDVYRGAEGISPELARTRRYDRVIAPVHLDPDHPLLALAPVMSHHQAVAWLLEGRTPRPMVEISGAQGKTTTAHALAHAMPGAGILHTSRGTFGYPERALIQRKSIAPASVIEAAALARERNGWLIAEESIGVSGAGDLAILTSRKDFRIATGKKSALSEKWRSIRRAPLRLLPPGCAARAPNEVSVEDAVQCRGDECIYTCNGWIGSFRNPLLALSAYREPLMMAAAAACLLSVDPAPLTAFPALEGRMAHRWSAGTLIVDNANSGTSAETTIEAAAYARALAGRADLTIVIGEESRAVCEGFPEEDIRRAIAAIRPDRVVRVGEGGDAATLAAGEEIARSITERGSILLAVKTWR
ncbi:MAG: coenzyme F430 synthase [Methanomicrobiales archaeon]|nr:coenzyme F430 synthase [Methanomicrobiales archaeon]MDI6877292.1 coenzyme F430 synthase [Methanomicrobiales archaeon]